MAFRVKISAEGHDSYGAHREGAHDDLVLALSCAVWYAEKEAGSRRRPTQGTRIFTTL